MTQSNPTKKQRQKWARKYAKMQGVAATAGGKKTVCASACIGTFGVPRGSYRYAQCVRDVVNVLRRAGWSVRCVAHKLPCGVDASRTVGGIRKLIKSGALGDGDFVINVPGHAMVLGPDGQTKTDTDPRKRDRREVFDIYLVRRKR